MLPEQSSSSLFSQSDSLKERHRRIWRQIWCSPIMIFIYCWAVLFFSLFLYVGYQRALIYDSMQAKYLSDVNSYSSNWFMGRGIVCK